MSVEQAEQQAGAQAPAVHGQPSPKKRAGSAAERELLFKVWKTIVEVQMHFNDMLMRVRNLAVTLILAVFGAAAFSLQYELYFQLPFGLGVSHLAALIIVFGLVAWLGIWFVDRYYHKLLVGAVSKSTEIEDTYDEDWLGMTHAITRESRTLFGKRDAMKARNQISLFLYLPTLVMGLLYIWAVVFWFQPRYAKGASIGEAGKAETVPQAPRVAPVERPSVEVPKESPGGVPPPPIPAPRK